MSSKVKCALNNYPVFASLEAKDAPDTDLAGYPAGQISDYAESRIFDIR
jgi:hypothetical protein